MKEKEILGSNVIAEIEETMKILLKPTKEHREKLSIQQKEMCWITNGVETKRIYKSDKDKFDSSWYLGHRFNKSN